MTLNLKHSQWHEHGRTYQILDAQNSPILGKYAYKAQIGEQQTSDGTGGFVPFLWKGATNELQYGKDLYNLEFASDKQIIKKAAQVLCSSFKFFVQAYVGGQWVTQPHGAPTRQIRPDEVFRDGVWEDDDTKCTGFLSFPDAALTFGGNKPYDLYLGLEAGGGPSPALGG